LPSSTTTSDSHIYITYMSWLNHQTWFWRNKSSGISFVFGRSNW